MCKLVKWFNSKDWQEPGSKRILAQNSLVKSTQQRILNSRKFEFSSYAVAVQLPPQQQSRQDHSFYVVPYPVADLGGGMGGMHPPHQPKHNMHPAYV